LNVQASGEIASIYARTLTRLRSVKCFFATKKNYRYRAVTDKKAFNLILTLPRLLVALLPFFVRLYGVKVDRGENFSEVLLEFC
jgi:hypothetical protein